MKKMEVTNCLTGEITQVYRYHHQSICHFEFECDFSVRKKEKYLNHPTAY